MSESNALDGLQQIRAMMSSKRKAPMIEKLGLDLVAKRGHAVFEEHLIAAYNRLGGVHGGYAATLLDSACGIAVHSQLGPRRGHSTLEIKISYLRGLTEKSGTVRAVGHVTSMGLRVAFAEATLHDGAGQLCATATSTLLVFDIEPGTPALF